MKKMLILLIVYLLTLNIIKTETAILQLPLIGYEIYLDAGHGGIDPGAVYKDINEKDIALAITLKLKQALVEKGATIYLTRESDKDLADPNATYRKRSDLGNRATLINASTAELYLSIHLNSYPSSKWSGAQSFFTNKNPQNKVLAEIIQNELKEKLKTKRDFKEIKNMYMYDRLTKPGILIEVGFISNSSERQKLLSSDYQEQLVDAIASGIVKYFRQL